GVVRAPGGGRLLRPGRAGDGPPGAPRRGALRPGAARHGWLRGGGGAAPGPGDHRLPPDRGDRLRSGGRLAALGRRRLRRPPDEAGGGGCAPTGAGVDVPPAVETTGCSGETRPPT